MAWSTIAWLALSTNLAVAVSAQTIWMDGQVNSTMCAWLAPRVATMRDTVYIDGGYLRWSPGMSNGEYGREITDNNFDGLIYTLSFNQSFNITANISDVMGRIQKSSDFAPNYFDGAMLANDHEFILFGGLLSASNVTVEPNEDVLMVYRDQQYGTNKPLFQRGTVPAKLPEDMNRYITYGGAASSPSENKAWYFGGAGSTSGGKIYFPDGNNETEPVRVSNTLITVDFAIQQEEVWSNDTLPPEIRGRDNPELVWVPVGEQGILVALGGVVFPNYDNVVSMSLNEAQSEADSPAFMSTIDIYDIAGKAWYKQKTIAGPGQLARGCAVVAPARDGSSYNIYYYGGYDGLHESEDFNDDVWILSLPSFMWMKVASGRKDHARAGHRCVTPYPDQMMVIGGQASLKGSRCVKDNEIVQVFNLTSGKWMDAYDPAKYGDYGVPEMIHLMIGGDYAGGATMTTPTPTGWDNESLASVFMTAYPTTKIQTYYPYSSDSARGDRPNVGSGGGGGLASWVAPVLGVVLGLVFITALVVAILLYRRRKLLRRNTNPNMSEGGTDENGNRILSWIRGQDTAKAPTVTTEDTPNLDDTESRVGGPQMAYMHSQGSRSPLHAQPQQPQATAVPHEMPDTPLFEMMDTSPRIELSDTGLTPVDIINKHSHFARSPQSATTPTNPSSLSHSRYAVSQDHTSVSSNSAHRLVSGPASEGRPDSPPLGGAPAQAGAAAEAAPAVVTPAQNPERIVSGVSNLSERDASHLRHISDTSVSSAAATFPGEGATRSGATSPALLSPMQAQPHDSGKLSPPLPVSPPTADEREATDYLSAHQGRSLTSQMNSTNTANTASTTSPLRRSVFYESADDLGESYKQQQQSQQPPNR